MIELKFTPGPWVIKRDQSEYGIAFFIMAPNSGIPISIAEVPEDNHHYNSDTEALDNAKLIAAAPEMYEAIGKYIDAIESGEVVNQFDDLKSAYKKATS